MGTPLKSWVDEADTKKCQISVVQMVEKPGTLFLSYTGSPPLTPFFETLTKPCKQKTVFSTKSPKHLAFPKSTFFAYQ